MSLKNLLISLAANMTSTNNGVAEPPSEKAMDKHRDLERDSETSSVSKGDLLSLEHVDPVLNAKMSLINDVSSEFWHNIKQLDMFR